jgi:hypothetical protein
MTRLAAVAVCAAALWSASVAHAADYAGDFSITNGNPNGQWTYGYATSLTPGYALVPYTATGSSSGYESWLGNIGGDGTPVVSHNTNASTFNSGSVSVPAGAAALHPGPGNQLSVARFTAPAAGTYDLAATFTGYDIVGTSTDVHILHNGTSLFSSSVLGYLATASHAQPLTLAAGDTVDFAVGTFNGSYAFDTTGLAASVAVPEPSLAVAAFATSAAFGVARRRRPQHS